MPQLEGRQLRSSTRTPVVDNTSTASLPLPAPSAKKRGISPRVIARGSRLPGLDADELFLLRRKQRRLLATKASTLGNVGSEPSLRNALESTWIFAQYEAGTAVSVAPGWILTCGHCFGDDDVEYAADSRHRWLLSYTGRAVRVKCVTRDSRRDLALTKVVTVEADETGGTGLETQKYVELAERAPAKREAIICLGQPGADDLESTTQRKTKYNLVEVSEGRLNGMADSDPQDNSEIGSLMHDAWTYWGHSGAPLIRTKDGTLVGLHSSWDDETAMRHGVPWIAIREFLRENEHLIEDETEKESGRTGSANTTTIKPGTTTSLESDQGTNVDTAIMIED